MPTPRFRIRTLMIAVAVVGAIGGIGGTVSGLSAPKAVTFLYTLEGPDPPANFSPVAWGARQGVFGGIALGVAGCIVACLVARLISWRPRMTTRRWMVAVAVVACLAWALPPAIDLIRNPVTLHHIFERRGSREPGSIYARQHPSPFWPRYWRRLLGRPWPGDYVCEDCDHQNGRWARLVISGAEPRPVPGRAPTGSRRSMFQRYREEYLPRHWRRVPGEGWSNDYR